MFNSGATTPASLAEILTASSKEKKRMYERVLEKAAERQRAVLIEAEKVAANKAKEPSK
ncbi:hypothetical protein PVT68_13620 [Microbulbifer bruguierae]|uniref:Uncharacterized protein n=1 Tax=Microbulbifer bruguierae TaxID=3029061 RepID=A0ABY8NAV4_9GAMM|nr:hypothetical protein [Microbulbifer bruguierae]WGL15805.1 hypothetical protein PVT68_13620 [Microbulbifer bruguierae]